MPQRYRQPVDLIGWHVDRAGAFLARRLELEGAAQRLSARIYAPRTIKP